MTRSTPKSSGSGNITPASMSRAVSPQAMSSMFMPNSPTPPSGMTSTPAALDRPADCCNGAIASSGHGDRASVAHRRSSAAVREHRVSARGARPIGSLGRPENRLETGANYSTGVGWPGAIPGGSTAPRRTARSAAPVPPETTSQLGDVDRSRRHRGSRLGWAQAPSANWRVSFGAG
jgi:hypothetical protein